MVAVAMMLILMMPCRIRLLCRRWQVVSIGDATRVAMLAGDTAGERAGLTPRHESCHLRLQLSP